jgi:BNR repeat protein
MLTEKFARAVTCAGLAVTMAACGKPPVRFGAAQVLSNTTAVGAAPMFAVAPNGDQAAAWVSAPGGGTDGRLYVSVNGAQPVMLRDTLGPIEPHGEVPPKLAYEPNGTLAALYVVGKLMPGKRFPASALRFVRSADGGRTWSEPVTVTDDGDFGSNSFHALHASADGTLFAAWLDSREGKSAVFLSRSTDEGRTWEPNRRINLGEACPCCRTAIATGANGTVYLAWREVAAGNVRDIVVARSTDNGATFGPASRVHADGWIIDGCPHAGPSMQVDSRGRLHIAWWTGKEGGAGVWYAQSPDGLTFSAPVPLGVAQQSRPAHVQLALTSGDKIVAAWDDGTVRLPRVMVRVSMNGGQSFAPAEQLSPTGTAAQFPVLAVRGDSIAVAWTGQSAAAHDRELKAQPNMKMAGMTMPLHAVGEAEVMVRRGRILD